MKIVIFMPDTEEPFGIRLRRERERRQIPLSCISANTKISVALFEALERGDVSRWPAGLYRRCFIRAYAKGVGLNVDAVTREFLELFPDPAEPVAPAADATHSSSASGSTLLRLTMADADATFAGGRLLSDMRGRWAAVACDAGVVVAISTTVYMASGKFWLPLAVAMLGYYQGGILLLGNTPGVCLWAPPPGQTGMGSQTALAIRATIGKSVSGWLVRLNRVLSPRSSRGTLRSDP